MKTKFNHRKGGILGRTSSAYLRVQVVDELDCLLQVTSMYRVSYLYPLLDKAVIWLTVDIGFHGKLFGCGRIALGDQIVHDEVVDISV